MSTPLIFEISKEGKGSHRFPASGVPRKAASEYIPSKFLRDSGPELPEASEPEVVRHFLRLSQLNMGVDTHFYPLGSCTMKYNPKINESIADQPHFRNIHPYQHPGSVQGLLAIVYELGEFLKEISGMDAVSLQPAAGAHAELTSLLMARAYFESRGERRTRILIPDSAHGTNPASCRQAGFQPIEIRSGPGGEIDLADMEKKLDSEVACLMITNPNTLGLFERGIGEIAGMVHQKGSLLYLDGANLNAILGISRPGNWGVDIMHFNLHKTFSTPHGGGGPGSGPVGVKKRLAPFLPLPRIEKRGEYHLSYAPGESIGKVRSFYGNVQAMVKAYAYIRLLGKEGLREVSETAVLNANYMKEKLKKFYHLPYDRGCMHEFVISARKQKEKGVTALHIAKRLLDFGFHPPTIYFPLLVKEAMMIEPTETESKETLDAFIAAMIEIAEEADRDPEKVREAPHDLAIARLDEVKAARRPLVRWQR